MKTFDAIVIGGGIVGSATAYYLERAGIEKVAMIERGGLCDGSTGKCAGGFRQQFPTVSECMLAMQSCKIMSSLSEELGEDIEFNQGGYLTLAYTEEQMKIAKEKISMHRDLGIDVSWLDVQEIRSMAPWLNEKEGFLGASFCQTDGVVNSVKMSLAYARAAKNYGCELHLYSEATGIKVNSDRTFTIYTSNNNFNTKLLYICTGAYSAKIGRMLGFEIPVVPLAREKMITAPIEFFQPFLCVSPFHELHFNQTPNGSFYMSCGKNLIKRSEPSITHAFAQATRSAIARLVPKLAQVNIICHWSGLYETTPDGKPFIGKISKYEGLHIAAGFNGHGLMLAPAAAKELVSCSLGKKAPEWFDSFNIMRLKDNKISA